LSSLTNLVKLELSHMNIRRLKLMPSLTNLVKLELSHVEIDHLQLMPSFTNLVKLELSHVHIAHLHLNQAQSLEELHISWIQGVASSLLVHWTT
jgi:hypothetical protein